MPILGRARPPEQSWPAQVVNMILPDFPQWLSDTELSKALTDSVFAFPIIESVHIIAITLVVGSITILDLRLLGVASRERDPRDLIRSILPITWSAFTVAVITGCLLFAANPLTYAVNFYFRGKLVLLLIAGLNMALFHLVSQRHLERASAMLPRLSGAVSLVLWITIVAFGRWIGFTLQD
jgi:hypothetical protein